MREEDNEKRDLEEKTDKTLKEGFNKLSEEHRKQADIAHLLSDKIKHYTIAIGYNSKNAAALNGLGNVYGKKEDYSKAAEYHRKAIETDPTFAPAHANLGADCIFTGNYHEGIEHCKRAIDIDSTLAYAYYLLGKAYKKIGKKALAKEYEREGDKRRVELAWSVNS